MSKKLILILVAGAVALVIGSIIFLKQGNKTWKDGFVQNVRKGYCQLVGGKMLASGCGIAGCDMRCRFPYRDGGKPCQSSNDCSGACEVRGLDQYFPDSKWPLPKELMGCQRGENEMFDCKNVNLNARCQEWPKENCEQTWEYDRGVIRFNFGHCSI